MRYFALATDYDGTLAHHGQVAPLTLKALERLKSAGRRLIMVTGRELDDLLRVFPEVALFDRVVAENGALVYCPDTHKETLLGAPPPALFIDRLRQRGAQGISVGRVIVATWTPGETVALELIREMGLEHQVIFNKGAVMILPPGVNKAAGLAAALKELGLSPHNVVGVGDAENDHALLKLCECGVAVANALPALKDDANFVTRGPHGEGVAELINMMIGDDLASLDAAITGRAIVIGRQEDGAELRIHPGRESILVVGASGAGKSTFTTGVMERMAEACYQFCIIDPEGDYEGFGSTVTLGDAQTAPLLDEFMALLQKPDENIGANLVGLRLEDRPAFFESLFLRLREQRARTCRPHWLIIDETQHMLPRDRDSAALILPQELNGSLMITIKPEHVAQSILHAVDILVAIGPEAEAAVRDYARLLNRATPQLSAQPVRRGEGLAWFRRSDRPPIKFQVIPPSAHLRRHLRKYIEGEMEEARHFLFRGPEGKLHLRAQNLQMFLQMADGVDDETWLYHLRRGDYSRWFREGIKDPVLAGGAEPIERDPTLSAAASRAHIRRLIERRYTAAA